MAKIALARKNSPVLVDDRAPQEEERDYFCERDGLKFAGSHLLIDMWGASNLDEPELIEAALKDAARAAGATILHAHFHRFSPSGGVTGVVVLAESHITIHTWPERQFAAVDIFMCGSCDPTRALPVLRRAFRPSSLQLSDQKRGVLA